MLTEVERKIINELIISFKELDLKCNLRSCKVLVEHYIEYFQWCLDNDESPWQREKRIYS